MLPPVETATEDRITVQVDAGWLGHLIITYERITMRHRKHSHRAWIAVRAVKAEG
jgi:hypothetical protein